MNKAITWNKDTGKQKDKSYYAGIDKMMKISSLSYHKVKKL